MPDFAEFDAYVEDWMSDHPGEIADVPGLCGQYLAEQTGAAIIGGPVGQAPTLVAIP